MSPLGYNVTYCNKMCSKFGHCSHSGPVSSFSRIMHYTNKEQNTVHMYDWFPFIKVSLRNIKQTVFSDLYILLHYVTRLYAYQLCIGETWFTLFHDIKNPCYAVTVTFFRTHDTVTLLTRNTQACVVGVAVSYDLQIALYVPFEGQQYIFNV